MIVLRLELHSANTGKVTELARMHICNDGTSSTAKRGSYVGRTFVGRDKDALDKLTVSRTGEVRDYPRQAVHVWNLVARMLAAMGYSQ